MMQLTITITERPGVPYPILVQISSGDTVIAAKGFGYLDEAAVPNNWANCGGPRHVTQSDCELFARCFEHSMNLMDRYHHICAKKD